MDNQVQNEVVTSPEPTAEETNTVKTATQDGQEGMVITNTASGKDISTNKIRAEFYRNIQKLASPGEISESERRRRRSANKRSRLSRKRNQKIARLKRGKTK